MSQAYLDRSRQNDSNSSNNTPSQQKEDFEAQMKKLDMNINNPGWNTADISPAQMFAEEEEEKQAKANEEELQMKPGEEEELQKKEDSKNPGTKTSMPNDLQSRMENSFGVDFSDVDIHKDSEQAPSLSSLAYTQGNDIHFAPGQYDPGSQKGQELLGHELSHVVQQRDGRVKPDSQQNKADANVNTDEGLEKEADEQGKQAAQGKMADVRGKGSGIKRKKTEKGNSNFNLFSAIKDFFYNLNGAFDDKKEQQKESETVFTVPKGWGLYKIADELGVSVKALKNINKDKLHYNKNDKNKSNPYFYEGEKIIIPGHESLGEIWLKKKFNLDEINFDWIKNVSSSIGNSFSKFVNYFNLSKESQYENQRDNTFDDTDIYKSYTDRVYGDNMCNVTSLAMSLKGHADTNSIKETLLKQLEENGYSENRVNEIKNYDIEDLIMYRFDQLGEEYWLEGIRSYFKDTSFTFNNTNPPHQWGYCLTEMGKLIVSDLETVYVRKPSMKQSEDNIKQHFIEEVKPKVDSGVGIIASTYLTGGHIVYLHAVHNVGIVIHDPYGLNMGEKGDYLRNSAQLGKTEKQKLDQHLNGVIKKRLKYRPELLNDLEQIQKRGSGIIPGNVGEHNFYNWSEVKSLKIGRWMIGLNEKK